MKHQVVDTFMQERKLSAPFKPFAEMIYEDLLNLLAFIHRASTSGKMREPFIFTSQIVVLDQMWHAFILNTRLYNRYCMAEFGEFLHHVPCASGELKYSNEALAAVVDEQIELMIEDMGVEFSNRIYFKYAKCFESEEKYVG